MCNNQRPLLHAISAVIEDGDEILFVERAAVDTYPGYWSSVTGSIEPGETQQQAVIRECMEEVGLRVKPVRKLWESATRRAPFVLHWWECCLDGPREVRPDASEVAAYRWLKYDEIARMPLMFADSRWFFREVYPVTAKEGQTPFRRRKGV